MVTEVQSSAGNLWVCGYGNMLGYEYSVCGCAALIPGAREGVLGSLDLANHSIKDMSISIHPLVTDIASTSRTKPAFYIVRNVHSMHEDFGPPV